MNPSLPAVGQDDLPRPWYKEPWPWILFGIPGLTVIAGLATLTIAMLNPNALLSNTTTDTKKQGYREIVAKERAIYAEVGWNNKRQMHLALSANTAMPDTALSVQLFKIMKEDKGAKPSDINNSGISSNRPAQNISLRHSGGGRILSLELTKNAEGAFVSKNILTPEQISDDYWLEVIGQKAAWSLSGYMASGVRTTLRAQ